MVEHKCKKCGLVFLKKSHWTQHINKKKTCEIINTKKTKPLNTTFLTPNIIEKPPINNPNIFNNYSDIICKYCYKTFSRKDVLNKHLKNNCKVKKQHNDEKEEIFKKLLLQETILKEKEIELNKKNEQINKLISQNDLLINKINVLEEKVDKISSVKSKKTITNTTNNNIINTSNTNSNNTSNTNTSNTSNTNNGIIVQLVNYGKEDLDKIDMKHFINNVVKNSKACGVKIPEEILKLIHFNPAYPELNNIYISDINREKCMIYDDGMWKLTTDDKIPEVIDKVVNFSYEKENELREKYPDNKPLIDRLNTINKYTKLNDNEYLEELKEVQVEEQSDNTEQIKRCEEFQKKTYDTFKTTMYNEGIKMKKNIKNKLKK